MITTATVLDTLNSLRAHDNVGEVMEQYGIDLPQTDLDSLALQTMFGVGHQYAELGEPVDRLEMVMQMVAYALVTGLAAGLKLERAAQLERMAA